MVYHNRREAGQILAQHLSAYAQRPDVIVLALPRGGVPVGFEIARALEVPLDVFLVRKLGVPGQEELAMGAIASGGVRVLNESVLLSLGIGEAEIEEASRQELAEMRRREDSYRHGRPAPDLHGKVTILVDDGLATGASMRAAVEAVRLQDPARIIVAVPTGAPETCQEFEAVADEVICSQMPEPFYAVGMYYQDFSQTTDEEVENLLARAARELQDSSHLPGTSRAGY